MIAKDKQKTTQRTGTDHDETCEKCKGHIPAGSWAVVKYGVITKQYYHQECWGK